MPFLNAAATISQAHCKKRMQNQFQECEALPSGGPSTFMSQMTQIRLRRMVNVIAWVIAGLIDGWPLLIIEEGGERKKKKDLCDK